MDRYTTAGAILILLGILWTARAVYVNRTGGSAIAETKILVGWIDMDILSALGIYPVFFIIWFGGNIMFGNMVAIQVIVDWINTLNTTGNFNISPWTIGIIAMAPSSAQWWIKQFAPASNKTFVITCIIIATDVTLNAFGFWSLADMPTSYDNMGVGHWVVMVVFIALAGFVNVYCENIVHDSLSRLIRWFKGQPVKGAI